MLKKETAKKIVLDSVNERWERELPFEVRDEACYEFEEAFIMYISEIESGAFILGGSGYLVEKSNGNLHVISHRDNIEEMIESYREGPPYI